MACKPVIVFSHANGFPAGTYRQLFALWKAAGYRVEAVDKFGHDPAYPVTSNWPQVRQQLLDFLERKAPGGAFLVGHSLGGLLSLMAASKRPDLARGVVMLDSPVIGGWRAHTIQVFKATGLIKRVSPGKVSQSRRHEWPDRDAVRAHYAAKSVFARWAPGVLDDYIESGTVRRGGKTVLAFDRDIETRFYNTLPHNLPATLRRHPVRCPVGFIAGRQSVEMRQGGVALARALAGDRFVWVDGGHLYPMEQPEATAAQVLALIEGMGPRL